MRRVLALILAVSMLIVVVAVAGCGETTPNETTKPSETTQTTPSAGTTGSTPAETTGGTPAETTGGTPAHTTVSTSDSSVISADPFKDYTGKTKVPGFEDVDFRGETFVFAGNSNPDYAFSKLASQEVYSEDDDAISVAVRTRNETISKLYNCSIEVKEATDPWSLAGADITGNTQTIDYVMIASHDQLKQAQNGRIYNLLSFDIDFSNPWWDQNFIANATIKNNSGENRMFYAMGDYSIFAMSCIYTLMFSKTVYESAGIETRVGNVYDLVKTGKWTYDVFTEMIKAAATEVSGNSELHASEGDLIGWMNTSEAPYALLMSANLPFIEAKDGVLTFAAGANASEWTDVVDRAIGVWGLEQCETISYSQIPDYVKANQALFVSEVLDVLARWKDSDISMGLVPYPKHSESQVGYANYVEGHHQSIAVPISVTNIDESAKFLEIYAAHSRYIVRPAWIDTYSYEYCGDMDSGEMLNIILDARVYDPCYTLFRNYYGEVSAMVSSGKNNFTKWVTRSGDKLTQEITNHVVARK